jgi:signal transduction histidine kinase
MMSVGGLAAGMAHEINNPLGGILQACQNIERRTKPDLPKNQQVAGELGVDLDAMARYLQERGVYDFILGIRDDGQRAAKIVADMLAFSRRSESHFAPANLPDLVRTALRLAANDYDLKKHYDFRRIAIEEDFEPSLPQVRCDKTKIEQVLLNLVKNAAQAMGECEGLDDPRIAVKLKRDGEWVQIEVIDNGPGMDEKTRRRVFEPFFTTKEPGVGTGLGLSVSYFIITKQHKGTMKVEPAPGRGTHFTIRLPLNVES